MAVKLRLMRMGKKKQPTYRVVAADSRSPRDGRFIEIVGFYDPRRDPSVVRIDNDKAVRWLENGARPTERVEKLLKISGAWEEFSGEPPPPAVTRIADAAAEKAEQAAEAVSDAAGAVAGKVEDAAEAVADKIEDAAEAVAEKVEDAAEAVSDAADGDEDAGDEDAGDEDAEAGESVSGGEDDDQEKSE